MITYRAARRLAMRMYEDGARSGRINGASEVMQHLLRDPDLRGRKNRQAVMRGFFRVYDDIMEEMAGDE